MVAVPFDKRQWLDGLPTVFQDSRFFNPCPDGHPDDHFIWEGEKTCRRCGRAIKWWNKMLEEN